MCELNQSLTRKEDQKQSRAKETNVKQKQLCELFAETRSNCRNCIFIKLSSKIRYLTEPDF